MTGKYIAADNTTVYLTGRTQYVPGIGALSGNETDEELAVFGLTPVADEETDTTTEETSTGRSYYSKLELIRALKKLDQLDAFLSWLASDAGLEAEWNAAREIASDDESFGKALATFVAAVSLTDEEAAEILAGCEL